MRKFWIGAAAFLAVTGFVAGEVQASTPNVKSNITVVEEKPDDTRARCSVLVGGLVKSHKGVNLPGVPIPIPALTQKDVDDLNAKYGNSIAGDVLEGTTVLLRNGAAHFCHSRDRFCTNLVLAWHVVDWEPAEAADANGPTRTASERHE